jgi:hypothetical protein
MPGSVLAHWSSVFTYRRVQNCEATSQHRERKVDTRCDATASKHVAISHDSCGIGRCSEGGQCIAPGPVRCGALTLKKSRRAEHQRAGTDGGHITRGLGEAPELRKQFLILHGFDRAEAARHANERAALDVCKPPHFCEHEPTIGLEVPTRARGQNALGAGKARKNFVRTGEIELSDVRINRKDDRKLFSHGDLPCSQ